MTIRRTAFFISDGTGITAETLGNSLLTQFPQVTFEPIVLPYTDTLEKAQQAAALIDQKAMAEGLKPIVFATLVNPTLQACITNSQGFIMDFFNTFMGPLATELHVSSASQMGLSHGIHNAVHYQLRIDALNYTLTTDDGLNTQHYEAADVILLGVSRSGKTPTCLYLALQFGLKAANYPITEEDLTVNVLPTALQKNQKKLFGLLIEPGRLQKIRSERLNPNNRYASLAQCQYELEKTRVLLQRYQVPWLDTTSLSIEEIATKLVSQLGLKRQLF